MPPLARAAWIEVDLDALTGNLAALRDAAGPGVRIEPVVKADAYGHGAVVVARTLEDAGVDGLSVATLDEALELRAAGIALPLLVLFPIPPSGVPAAIAAGDRREPRRRRAVGRRRGGGGPGRRGRGAAGPLDVHLEVDTGLGRGGVAPEVAAETIRRIQAAPGVRLAGVWTHLAAAERPDSVREQDATFRAALSPLAEAVAWGRGRRRSGATWPAAAGSWARVPRGGRPSAPGSASTGSSPRAWWPGPAATGRSRGCARCSASTPAGPRDRAGRRPRGQLRAVFVTERVRGSRTLPVGYGDGWHRSYSDRASALVRGVRVPLVGRVAMDAVMADVTDVPGRRSPPTRSSC